MLDELLGHGRQRLEQVGEDAAVGGGDRLVGIDQEEADGAVVGVDHDLDAVADVVRAAKWLVAGNGCAFG